VVLSFDLDDLVAWIERIPPPGDCVDGFFEAFWRRPEALLDPAVRSAQSMRALLGADVEQKMIARLAAALESGSWDAEHGHLRREQSGDFGAECL